MKTCSKCDVEKDVADFRVDRRVPSGRQSACAACQTETTRKYRQRNPIKCMLSRACSRATKDGVIFNLKETDVIIPETCPILGIPLARGTKPGGNPNSPSLDRIIPSLGYIVGNIIVISTKANRMKNDATPEELRYFASWVGRTYA